MKALRPLSLLSVMVFCFVAFATSALAAVPSWGDPKIPYGQQFSRLNGDLSPSGLSGIDARPAYLNRWEAYFNENLVSKKTLNYLDRYDVFNIMETNEGDNFDKRRGYGLLPQKEDVIKKFVKLANGNADYVWNIVKNYNSVTQKGFYLLNYRPYISMNHLVELSGGSFDRLENRVQDDPGQINGTVYFNVSPWPKITSAVIDGDEVQISFVTYGLNDLHRPKAIITNGSDQIEKDFGYTSQHIYNGSWTLPVGEVERLGQPDRLKVIVTDGFGRTAEAWLQPIDKKMNLSIHFRDLPVQAEENTYVRPVKIVVTNEGSEPVTAKVSYTNRWREARQVCSFGDCSVVVEWFNETKEKTLTIPARSDVTWDVEAYTGISYLWPSGIAPPGLLISLYPGQTPAYTELTATVSAEEDIVETRYDDNSTSARINISTKPVIKKRGVLSK